ncbi:PREDICTED: uncharacterized protein LOC109476293 isoform X2 [Branchiostoma belcheri]|uniref:Uncharacterized protein LOC109476293 isoform X2 n=1 Tax=Branchiostoma belcheri TaxID=7741 RepID=A0A6P4ZFP1_BRABE|nr:PREDICTED: uncharacterized protein LOC109476293 isoform X2 [Branchiostoma belcheri]
MKLQSFLPILAVLVALAIVNNAQVTENTTAPLGCPCYFNTSRWDPACCNVPAAGSEVTDQTLFCPACVSVNTREECLQAPLQLCANLTESYCVTTVLKLADLDEAWTNRCESKETCLQEKEDNDRLCNLGSKTYTCVSCCNANGCVGGGGGATTLRVSLVAMATVTFLTTMKNALDL